MALHFGSFITRYFDIIYKQKSTMSIVTQYFFPNSEMKRQYDKFRQKNRKQKFSIVLYGNWWDNHKILANQIAWLNPYRDLDFGR